MFNFKKISKLHQEERKAEPKNTDFIYAHNTMLQYSEEYKIEYFPVDGQQLREMREKLLIDCLETQCELEYQLYKVKKRWAEDSNLAHFINSSRERQQIFWAFNRRGYEHGWTVGMMAEYLERDVAATSRDLTAMQQKKFISRNIDEGYQRYYLPSERLLNSGKYFVEHYVDLTLGLTETPQRYAFFNYRAAERTAFKKR